MRRMLLTLVGVAAIGFGSTQTAWAHGVNHHGYRGPVSHRAYYPNYGRGYVAGYGLPYGAGYGGGYGCGNYTAGYGVPGYGYAYPQAGFGVAGRNFSLWLGR